jgi:hypothetical protein
MYLWVYNNFALIDIDWSSVTVWIVTFLGVDLGYYGTQTGIGPSQREFSSALLLALF